MSYSLAALREYRERKTAQRHLPIEPSSELEQASPDAPMDDELVFGCWNGERFVSWAQWRATTPLKVDGAREPESQDVVTAASALCGGTRVCLIRNGGRWLMFAGSRREGTRRKDFASPYLEQSKRTAEAWYGPAEGGWRVEREKEVLEATE